MVLDREQIRRVTEKPPDKTGEEGRVYFFGKPEQPRALKAWYATHEQRALKKNFERNIPISPFFHKARFYEMSVIHDLFPDHTVGVVGSADQRIMKDEAGEIQFSVDAALPIVVMNRAIGDPVLAAKMDELVSAAYEDFETGRASLTEDLSVSPIPAMRKHWDEMIIQTFHPALADTMRLSGALEIPDRKDAVDATLRYAKKHHPDSIVVEMLEYGIVPAHPAMNFIPKAPQNNLKQPHGNFVEVQIIDSIRLRAKLMAKDEAKQQLKKLNRFELFQQLDYAYVLLFREADQEIIADPTVQTCAYKLLRAGEQYLTALGQRRPNYIDMMAECNKISSSHGHDRSAFITAMQSLEQDIIQQMRVEQFMQAIDKVYQSIPVLADNNPTTAAHKAFITLMRPFFKDQALVETVGQQLLEAFKPLQNSQLPDVELAVAITEIKTSLAALTNH